jgi:hypothetical protein
VTAPSLRNLRIDEMMSPDQWIFALAAQPEAMLSGPGIMHKGSFLAKPTHFAASEVKTKSCRVNDIERVT